MFCASKLLIKTHPLKPKSSWLTSRTAKHILHLNSIFVVTYKTDIILYVLDIVFRRGNFWRFSVIRFSEANWLHKYFLVKQESKFAALFQSLFAICIITHIHGSDLQRRTSPKSVANVMYTGGTHAFLASPIFSGESKTQLRTWFEYPPSVYLLVILWPTFWPKRIVLFLWALCMMESINQAQSQTQTQAKLSLQCILLSDPPFPRGARYEGSKVEKNICWFVVLTEQIRDISCRHESTPSGEICLSFFSGWFQSLSRGFWKFHETSQLLFHSSHFISHEKEGFIFVEAKDYILAINFGSSMAKNKNAPLLRRKMELFLGQGKKEANSLRLKSFHFFHPLPSLVVFPPTWLLMHDGERQIAFEKVLEKIHT